MPAKQIALLEQVAAANQNVVVVLSNGSVITVAPWAKNAKGILESWLLGQSGGPALADVIFGQVSPPASSPSRFRWTSAMTRAR